MVAFENLLANAGRWTADAMRGGATLMDRSLNEKVVRLGVTGLSRSGKTVFITSLIQNLIALGAKINSLPDITKCLTKSNYSRLSGVYVIPAGTEVIPWFDFPSNIKLLSCENPVWPRPTDDLSTISLMLEIERTTNKYLGSKRVKLEILDYPGEWLLDLPLLSLSFQEWSRQTLDMIREEPHSQCFVEFQKYVSGNIDPKSNAEEDTIRGSHQRYKKGLMECRELYGMQYLQPGRFICPGPKGGDLPFLWFFPLEIGDLIPRAGSVAEQMVRRFDRYKAYVKEEFFDSYFSQFDRQIMLVDVLTALYKGRVVFNDTKRAIDDISKALASQKIRKLAVAATKADHVHPYSRDNLVKLLEILTNGALSGKKSGSVSFHAIAAIDSTTPTKVTIEDRSMPAVAGVVDGKLRPYYVGEVPPTVPGDDYFSHDFFQLPGFQPRKYEPKDGTIKQIGVDFVLAAVIGDIL